MYGKPTQVLSPCVKVLIGRNKCLSNSVASGFREQSVHAVVCVLGHRFGGIIAVGDEVRVTVNRVCLESSGPFDQATLDIIVVSRDDVLRRSAYVVVKGLVIESNVRALPTRPIGDVDGVATRFCNLDEIVG